MPFLTEELWHKLPQRAGAKSIALAPFPGAQPTWRDAEAERQMALLQEIVVAARNIRAELKLEPKRKVAADISTSDAAVRELVENNMDAILRLATLSELKIAAGHFDPTSGAIRSTTEFDLRISYGEGIDMRAEVLRLRKETERLAKDLESKRSRLADDNFRSRAPAEIVRSLESTLAERQVEYQKLLERLSQLEKAAGQSA